MENNGNCSMSGEKKDCPIKCFVVPAFMVFATIFVFEWAFHGVLMKEEYEATASMWRSMEGMSSLMYICLIRQFVTACIITCLYCCVMQSSCENKCPVKSITFGFKIGLLLGITQFGSYAWMPFPDMSIPLAWLAGNTLLGMIIGAVLCRVCKKKPA